jgi:hypothetical protein
VCIKDDFFGTFLSKCVYKGCAAGGVFWDHFCQSVCIKDAPQANFFGTIFVKVCA